MLKSLAVAAALGLLAATPVAAQSVDGRSVYDTVPQPGDEPVVQGRRETSASRLRDRERSEMRDAAAGQPTKEMVMAEVTPLAAAAAPSCQPTDAALLGAREDGVRLYEIACATGPGYVIEAAAEGSKAHDCVLQWSFGVLAREADPAANVGLQCALPGNQNPTQVIAGYGRELGLNCEVDQAVATAVDVYEIGCAGRDGWRLEKSAAGWLSTECWQFALRTDGTCRYTSREESAAEWPKLVAGSDAAACQIEDVAWMGDNAERGSFYELKCSSGEGVIVRFKDGAAQQTYSCIDAQQIFRKPCSLTPTEAPAAAPAPSGGRA
jgi:hypothetical protein